MKKLIFILLLMLSPLILFGQHRYLKNVTVKDSLFIEKLATSDVKVLSPTSTGGTNSLETVLGTSITWSSLTADAITVTNNIDIGGYINGKNKIAQFHRIADIDVTSANTWIDVKLDTLIANESTKGYTFNADSTGIEVDFDGDTRIQGCGHWDWAGADAATVKIYTRVLINSIEARCLQTNQTRGRKTDDTGTISFTGTINHTSGQEIALQYRVDHVSMDFKADAVFANGVAFSINFEKINND